MVTHCATQCACSVSYRFTCGNRFATHTPTHLHTHPHPHTHTHTHYIIRFVNSLITGT